MRLGSRVTIIKDQNSLASKIHEGQPVIYERHRHRYEVNPEYVNQIHDGGLKLVGRDETGERMEVAELPGHKYYVGVQYHPEFKSRPLMPSPPFHGLILASTGQLQEFLD